MADYAARINEITTVRAQQLEACETQRRTLGASLAALDEPQRPDGIADLVDRHRDSVARIEAARGAIERMLHIDDRQTEIRTEMKRLQEEDDALEKGLTPAYERVGAVAFRLFKEHPLIDQSYSAAFEDLARYQDSMRSLDSQIGQIRAAESGRKRNILERITSGGKDLLLRNRRDAKAGQLPKLLQQAGRQLCRTDFVEQMEDEELTEAAQPYADAIARHQEIAARLDELKRESGELVADFNALSGGQRLPKARAAREQEIEAARSDLNAVLTDLGRAAQDHAPAALADGVAALTASEDRLHHFEQLLSRLQAGRQAELTDTQIATTESRIAQVREQLEAAQSELKGLKAEREKLLKTRGEEAELFDA